MERITRQALAACLLFIGCSAGATTVTATAATLKAAFANARSGDTITLSGTFAGATLRSMTFSKPLTIDARNAVFTNTLKIYDVTGLTILGGHFGSTTTAFTGASVLGGSRITFTAPVVVGDRTKSHGIDFSGTTKVVVDGGSFSGLRSAVALTQVTGGTISNNTSVASTSDGFDIAGSHNISITGNSCSGTAILPGAHPDCVQLWSLDGQPPQSDISVRNNTATGDTQGFTSFNAKDGGGLRIQMINNRVDISYTQGIACYECVDSVFSRNVVTTQAGARWQARMNIIGGSGNTITNNSIAAYVRAAMGLAPGDMDAFKDAASLREFEAVVFTDVPDGDALDPENAASVGAAARGVTDRTGAVPEPATWALLAAGFGSVGTAFRKRRRAVVAA